MTVNNRQRITVPKKPQFVIEHMEGTPYSPWSLLEYRHIVHIFKDNPEQLLFTNFEFNNSNTNTNMNMNTNIIQAFQTIESCLHDVLIKNDVDMEKVCILDPNAADMLKAEV